jgi:hypothetical protein
MVPEKTIQERSKETLKWIQKEQQNSGLGMVEFEKVPDQGAARYLLRSGDIFEPQAGMVKSTAEPEPEQPSGAAEGESGMPNHAPWVWKTPEAQTQR